MPKITKNRKAILEEELGVQRRKVDFDTFDITLSELLRMIEQEEVDIAPAYQRQYRWDEERASQLIESLFLGIPIPSLFMATNEDATWELVDGLQRLTSVAKFMGTKACRRVVKQYEPLRLVGLNKLQTFNDSTFEELPPTLQLQLRRRAFKVVTLSDKSDRIVRFDLFERLNRGGISLSPQEIRNCVLRGDFAEFLGELSRNRDFRKVLRLNRAQSQDATREECVLRFFSYYFYRNKFEHLVDLYLTQCMERMSKSFDYEFGQELFENTFSELAKVFPKGLRRIGKRAGTTSLILFEAVTVGAALALESKGKIDTTNIKEWLGSEQLKKFTTGSTNTKSAVNGRILFCKDRFLGKPITENVV